MRHTFTKEFGSAFSVAVLPTLKDNFTYLIQDHATGALAAVDVNTDTDAIMQYITERHPPLSLSNLRTILSTHKHWDHAGGNEKLRDCIGNTSAGPFRIVGGVKDNIPGATVAAQEGDVVDIGELRAEVLDVPCHTHGHVAFRVYHPSQPHVGSALFTGDTMFTAGIGAFFEGTAQDMCAAMAKFFHLNSPNGYALDAVTLVFPGHEYTATFMQFTETQLRDRPAFADDWVFVKEQAAAYARAVAAGRPSVPSSLAEEKRQNLFLRVADPTFRKAFGKENPVQLMDYLYSSCD